MFSALFSFLGGSVFRMVWGEISAYMTAKQEHQQELDRMKLQGELDAQVHTQQMEALKTQAELGIKTIEATAQAAVDETDEKAFADAVSAVGKTTGIYWLDVYNGVIRPTLATIAISMIVFNIVQKGFAIDDWDKELFGAILGIYVADRSLTNRGK